MIEATLTISIPIQHQLSAGTSEVYIIKNIAEVCDVSVKYTTTPDHIHVLARGRDIDVKSFKRLIENEYRS